MTHSLKEDRVAITEAATMLGLTRHRLIVEVALRRIRLVRKFGHLMLRTSDVRPLRGELAANTLERVN